MNAIELVKYYADLLIIQYIGKPKAYDTVSTFVTPFVMPQPYLQTLAFSAAPTSGSFTLTWGGNTTAPINWNDSNATVKMKIEALPNIGTVTTSGGISTLSLTIALNKFGQSGDFTVGSSTLVAGITPVSIAITSSDVPLKLAVENGFNLIGPNLAVGKQLDIIGKYVGVTRSALGFYENITLNDADFHTLISMAIANNTLGSSLADIQGFLNRYFAGFIYVFDYKNMRMSYIISSLVGSEGLLQLFITQKLLPRPMGVGISVLVTPQIDQFFGLCSYEQPVNNLVNPLNSYEDYQTTWPWVDYADSFT